MPRIGRMVSGRTSVVPASLRRKTTWIAATSAWSTLGSGLTQTVVAFNQAALAPLVPFTITRTVGIASIAFDEDFILDQDIFAAWGASVVKENAVLAAGALPLPITDIGDDVWFWHQPVAEFIESTFTGRSGLGVVINSKAQRKVVDGEAIVFRLQVDGSSDALERAMMVRILCKLH